MMGKGKDYSQQSSFTCVGQFLRFEIEDGYKIKHLWLGTATGEQCIKLTKEARASLITQGFVLTPGLWIQVTGQQKVKSHDVEPKLKAYWISPAAIAHSTAEPPTFLPEVTLPPIAASPAKSKTSILVCQKSDCVKRGSRGICQALETALHDRHLDDQVSIKSTGCMKHCKAGPNVVFMPDKTRYSRITPAEIPALVDKHFPPASPPRIATIEAVSSYN